MLQAKMPAKLEFNIPRGSIGREVETPAQAFRQTKPQVQGPAGSYVISQLTLSGVLFSRLSSKSFPLKGPR